MATFPKLKTDAWAQYPTRKTVGYQNETVRFVDGGEQRYSDCAAPLCEWRIRLDQLDESELARVEAFVEANQGQFGRFAFQDPWSGTVYPNCGLSSGQVKITAEGEMSGATELVVREEWE